MPTTSASLYEQLFPLTTVMKQRVVDNFSGDALNERWVTWNETGSGTFAMDDAVNGGYSITTSSGGRSGIDFNNIRQYEETGCVFIGVVKTDTTSNARIFAGFRNNGTTNGATQQAWLHGYGAGTYGLGTGDASTGATTLGSVSEDTNFHSVKIELTASDCEMTIDGVSDVTRTSNLSTVPMQPEIAARDDAATTPKVSVRYVECYNT